jgi:hypothetical protein
MTIAYITTRGSTGGTASGGITVFYPSSGIVAGDLLLLFIRNSSNTNVIRSETDLAGWIMAGESNRTGTHGWVFYRIATGSENGTSFNMKTETNDEKDARVIQYRGTDQTYPIAACYITNGSTSSPAVPAAKVALDDTLAVALMASNGNTITFTPPSGYTERYDSGASFCAFTVADMPVVPAQSTSGNFASSSSAIYTGFVLLLNPDYASGILVTPWAPAGTTSTFGGSGTIWSGTSNAAASDDSRATASQTGNFDTRGLWSQGHGILVPSGCRLVGVEVSAEGRFVTPTTSVPYQVHPTYWLFINGALQANTAAGKVGPRFNSFRTPAASFDETISWGGPGNMWDLDLLISQLDVGFGVGFVGTMPAFGGGGAITNSLEIDSLAARVWYVPPNHFFPRAA